MDHMTNGRIREQPEQQRDSKQVIETQNKNQSLQININQVMWPLNQCRTPSNQQNHQKIKDPITNPMITQPCGLK